MSKVQDYEFPEAIPLLGVVESFITDARLWFKLCPAKKRLRNLWKEVPEPACVSLLFLYLISAVSDL